MCDAPESNWAEIDPIEQAAKFRGKSRKGVSVCPVTLDKVVLYGVLHVVRYCLAVSAHAVLCMVGYYRTVTAHATLHATLVMLSQFDCCI